jgi:hypothetical protein
MKPVKFTVTGTVGEGEFKGVFEVDIKTLIWREHPDPDEDDDKIDARAFRITLHGVGNTPGPVIYCRSRSEVRATWSRPKCRKRLPMLA